jgi:hypothetical protein
VPIGTAHANALACQRVAEAEAASLLALYRQYPLPAFMAAKLLGVAMTAAGGGAGTAAGTAAPAGADSVAAPAAAAAPSAITPAAAVPASAGGAPSGPAAPVPLRLETIPWVPLPPRPRLLEAFAAAWREELWFGGGVGLQVKQAPRRAAAKPPGVGTVSAGGTPRASAAGTSDAAAGDAAGDGAGSSYAGSLSSVPCLSTRGLLVLLLRRVYENMHTGGFERLLPPPTAELADRYRAIAEFVPPNLRET